MYIIFGKLGLVVKEWYKRRSDLQIIVDGRTDGILTDFFYLFAFWFPWQPMKMSSG